MGDFSGVSKTSAYYIIYRVSAAIVRLQYNNLEIMNVVAHWHGSVYDSIIFNINVLLLGYSVYLSKQYFITSLLDLQTAAEQPYNESHICTQNIIFKNN